MFDPNLHHDLPEYAENTILAHIAEGTMTPEDGQLIRIFVGKLKATRGIPVARANKIVSHLCGWRHFIGPFTANRIPEIIVGVAALREAKPVSGTVTAPLAVPSTETVIDRFPRSRRHSPTP